MQYMELAHKDNYNIGLFATAFILQVIISKIKIMSFSRKKEFALICRITFLPRSFKNRPHRTVLRDIDRCSDLLERHQISKVSILRLGRWIAMLDFKREYR